MRITLLLFLTALPALATLPRVSWERETKEGVDRLAVEQDEAGWRVEKTSNYFDQQNDLRLGKLRAANPSAWSEIEAELAAVIELLRGADRRLASVGKDFNALNHHTPHEPHIMVGGWKVLPSSTLYPRLAAVLARAQALPLQLEEGVNLEANRKHYIFFKDGKEISREVFNARFFCADARFPTRCLARQWGAFYLE